MTKDDSALIIGHINEKFEGFDKKLDSLIKKFDVDHDKLTEHSSIIKSNKESIDEKIKDIRKDVDGVGGKLKDFQKDVNNNFKKMVVACVLLGSGFGIKEIIGALL